MSRENIQPIGAYETGNAQTGSWLLSRLNDDKQTMPQIGGLHMLVPLTDTNIGTNNTGLVIPSTVVGTPMPFATFATPGGRQFSLQSVHTSAGTYANVVVRFFLNGAQITDWLSAGSFQSAAADPIGQWSPRILTLNFDTVQVGCIGTTGAGVNGIYATGDARIDNWPGN
jgi:hypothetical protein